MTEPRGDSQMITDEEIRAEFDSAGDDVSQSVYERLNDDARKTIERMGLQGAIAASMAIPHEVVIKLKADHVGSDDCGAIEDIDREFVELVEQYERLVFAMMQLDMHNRQAAKGRH